MGAVGLPPLGGQGVSEGEVTKNIQIYSKL